MRKSIRNNIYVGAFTFGLALPMLLSNDNDNKEEKENTSSINEIQPRTCTLPPNRDSIEREKKKDRVRSTFKMFYPQVGDETINIFTKVCEDYEFDTNETVFNTCIAQICVESGSRHLNPDGTPLKSSGNAMGIGQIVPTTAFHFLKYEIPYNCPEKFRENTTDFSFVNKYKYTGFIDDEGNRGRYIAGEGREQIKNWLSNKRNNLYLWGYIMNKYLTRYNIPSSLLAYNQGIQFLRDYNGYPSNHTYIQKVELIKTNYINENPLISERN